MLAWNNQVDHILSYVREVPKQTTKRIPFQQLQGKPTSDLLKYGQSRSEDANFLKFERTLIHLLFAKLYRIVYSRVVTKTRSAKQQLGVSVFI